MSFSPGKWTFKDANLPGSDGVVIDIQDATPSKIAAAFTLANATLAVGNVDNLIGYDPSGIPLRWSSVKIGDVQE